MAAGQPERECRILADWGPPNASSQLELNRSKRHASAASKSCQTSCVAQKGKTLHLLIDSRYAKLEGQKGPIAFQVPSLKV